MKSLSDIYEDAAELLLNRVDDFACLAIFHASDMKRFHRAIETFQQNFQPQNLRSSDPWWSYFDTESRVLALLLCAEMCRKKKAKRSR